MRSRWLNRRRFDSRPASLRLSGQEATLARRYQRTSASLNNLFEVRQFSVAENRNVSLSRFLPTASLSECLIIGIVGPESRHARARELFSLTCAYLPVIRRRQSSGLLKLSFRGPESAHNDYL